ncbi:sensor histidine kinase [Variovorax atrisoli]|uniref:sensor histidine kinase n=1 Tax=Variovorax atrisoli TaxID=3394203 RepID=UPI00160CB02C|nr:sensor histidine kinase [Variovorax sp. BK613]MBB3642189.1 signal transduction histidine kinase [Variovorax sp. BK613]
MELHACGPSQDLATGIGKALREMASGMRGVLEHLQTNERPGYDGLALSLRGLVHRGEQLARHLQAYAGVQPLSPIQLETLPFLCDLAHALRRVVDERISVSVVVGHDCPPCLADRDALEDALMNLIANACEAMPQGGRLLLSARADTSPDGRPAVAMSVSDNGRGMPPEFARRAVEPFVTTKGDRAQAGMGLAATDGFARQSGGCLTLFSQVGSGVTATLSLPQSRPDMP